MAAERAAERAAVKKQGGRLGAEWKAGAGKAQAVRGPANLAPGPGRLGYPPRAPRPQSLRMPPPSTDTIAVRGAHEHNLQHVDLDLPRDALIVVTGVSGSGKSSLAFDTLFREGQRRYLETFPSYARQLLGKLERPAVEHIHGLSPALAVDQKSTVRNPRSTARPPL